MSGYSDYLVDGCPLLSLPLVADPVPFSINEEVVAYQSRLVNVSIY